MNGNWYSWGNQRNSPRVFIAAYRHVVTLFRERSARNVTWMWTVNVSDPAGQDSAADQLVAGQDRRKLGRHRRLLPNVIDAVQRLVRPHDQGDTRTDRCADP